MGQREIFHGIIVLKLEDGSEERISVYKNKKGDSISLHRGFISHLVHPSNVRGIEGWVKEVRIVWNLQIKEYRFLPPHLCI